MAKRGQKLQSSVAVGTLGEPYPSNVGLQTINLLPALASLLCLIQLLPLCSDCVRGCFQTSKIGFHCASTAHNRALRYITQGSSCSYLILRFHQAKTGSSHESLKVYKFLQLAITFVDRVSATIHRESIAFQPGLPGYFQKTAAEGFWASHMSRL